MDLAVEQPSDKGWVSLGFPDRPGKMMGAHCVAARPGAEASESHMRTELGARSGGSQRAPSVNQRSGASLPVASCRVGLLDDVFGVRHICLGLIVVCGPGPARCARPLRTIGLLAAHRRTDMRPLRLLSFERMASHGRVPVR